MPPTKKKKLTASERKKLEEIVRKARSKERVKAIVDVIDIGVANKILGGPVSAARQRRAAKKTGHKTEDLYTTSGTLARKFPRKRKKKN